jgi:protein CpxP
MPQRMAIHTVFCLSEAYRVEREFFEARRHLGKKCVSSLQMTTGETLFGETMEESENPMKMTIFRKTFLQIAFLALGMTVVSALPAMAQDPSAPPPVPDGQTGPQNGRGGMGEHQLEFLTKKLNLTPDQVTHVKAINDDSRKQLMALREDTSIAGADKRTKMMHIYKASQDKIRALLTEDQKTRYDALEAEIRERMENRRGGPGGTPPAPPSATQQ